jgi:hypothetical protein
MKGNVHIWEKKATDYSEIRLQISKEKFVKAKVNLPLCLYVKLGRYTCQMVCSIWGSVVRFIHLPLHPQGKNSLYPQNRRLDESQTMVVADRKISAPTRMKSFIHLLVMADHTISCVCSEEAAIRKHVAYSISQYYWWCWKLVLLILLHFMPDKIRNKSQYLPIAKAIHNFSALKKQN